MLRYGSFLYFTGFKPFCPGFDPQLNVIWLPTDVPKSLCPWSKKELKKFEIEVTTHAPWWRSQSVVRLKLLACLSSFILRLRMLEFMLKRGCLAIEKEEKLISLQHSSFSYLSLKLGFLVCTFWVREEIEEKLWPLEV